MESLSGNFHTSVARSTPSEQSLCSLTTLKCKASADCLFLARRYIDRAFERKEKRNLSGIEPRFQLFHVTTSLVTDCELEPTVKSVDQCSKT